jgi:hypothetical protein
MGSQKTNASLASFFEANYIHPMSIFMAQSTRSDILKDCMSMIVQRKEFFSSKFPSQIAENLGKALLS